MCKYQHILFHNIQIYNLSIVLRIYHNLDYLNFLNSYNFGHIQVQKFHFYIQILYNNLVYHIHFHYNHHNPQYIYLHDILYHYIQYISLLYCIFCNIDLFLYRIYYIQLHNKYRHHIGMNYLRMYHLNNKNQGFQDN